MDARFEHVHVDLVGLPPPSQGYTYLLTCMDCFTCWSETILLTNIATEVDAPVFLSGSPLHLYQIVAANLSLLSVVPAHHTLIHRTTTTSYHPYTNGKVERFYCQLKAALMTRASNTLLLDLPIVLLGTRAFTQSQPEVHYG